MTCPLGYTCRTDPDSCVPSGDPEPSSPIPGLTPFCPSGSVYSSNYLNESTAECFLYALPCEIDAGACPSNEVCLPAWWGIPPSESFGTIPLLDNGEICTPLMPCGVAADCPNGFDCASVNPSTGFPTGTCVDADGGPPDGATDAGFGDAGSADAALTDAQIDAQPLDAPMSGPAADVSTQASVDAGFTDSFLAPNSKSDGAGGDSSTGGE